MTRVLCLRARLMHVPVTGETRAQNMNVAENEIKPHIEDGKDVVNSIECV